MRTKNPRKPCEVESCGMLVHPRGRKNHMKFRHPGYYYTDTLNAVDKCQDAVNHPAHYTFGKYEVLPVLMDWFPHDPLKWQIVKYVARSGRKDDELEDLLKAAFYLNEKIQQVREKQSDAKQT